ncbi:Hypothetical predicted protein [Pelobates cultripes]|uniref:Uncharacterized protein n=1 Tax=Pelobates cultripes TaxID=61616 RepID=A0AAD1VRR4_PELCU|nr:Hypothetical predicted protein [Pelobates cultripes]
MDWGGDPGPYPVALIVTPQLRPRNPTATSKMAGTMHADNKGKISYLAITPKTAPTARSRHTGMGQTPSQPLQPLKPATRGMENTNKLEIAAAPGGQNSKQQPFLPGVTAPAAQRDTSTGGLTMHSLTTQPVTGLPGEPSSHT